jgi:hypothetical protein
MRDAVGCARTQSVSAGNAQPNARKRAIATAATAGRIPGRRSASPPIAATTMPRPIVWRTPLL